VTPEPEVVIFGGGHIGQCLARLCTAMDMPYRVYDTGDILTARAVPRRACLICAPFDAVGQQLNNLSYCVITTYGHDHDETVLEQLARNDEIPYIGMGQPEEGACADREHRGRGEQSISGSIAGRPEDRRNQPQEIALSILAEIILSAAAAPWNTCAGTGALLSAQQHALYTCPLSPN
jgi:xanthine dehydrogenase accessory factor